jgi:hypothetical protein
METQTRGVFAEMDVVTQEDELALEYAIQRGLRIFAEQILMRCR